MYIKTITGLTNFDYTQETAYSTVFSDATAQAMGNGVQSSYIKATKATLNAQTYSSFSLRKLVMTATTSVTVYYDVNIPNMALNGFSDPQIAFNAIKQSLNLAVGNGQYTSIIQSIAKSVSGASALTTASVNEQPSYGALQYQSGQPTPSPISLSNSNGLTDGAVGTSFVLSTMTRHDIYLLRSSSYFFAL